MGILKFFRKNFDQNLTEESEEIVFFIPVYLRNGEFFIKKSPKNIKIVNHKEVLCDLKYNYSSDSSKISNWNHSF